MHILFYTIIVVQVFKLNTCSGITPYAEKITGGIGHRTLAISFCSLAGICALRCLPKTNQVFLGPFLSFLKISSKSFQNFFSKALAEAYTPKMLVGWWVGKWVGGMVGWLVGR